MTDYSKLVKALRCCATMTCKGDECKYMILGCHDCFSKLHDDSAAAIEALQAETAGLKDAIRILKHNLEMKEPKRGEIVRCGECIHFTQGGWCDREFDWFPVDENDFCSMAEKMEVQDGQ